MAQHNDFGKEGEKIAVAYLKNIGYQILHTNWKLRKFEIDIIAEYQGITSIVEVKSRTMDVFGKPQDFVDSKKIKLLVQAVNAFAETQNRDLNIRFDIIAISKIEGRISVEHLTDAFYYF